MSAGEPSNGTERAQTGTTQARVNNACAVHTSLCAQTDRQTDGVMSGRVSGPHSST